MLLAQPNFNLTSMIKKVKKTVSSVIMGPYNRNNSKFIVNPNLKLIFASNLTLIA